MSGSAHRAMRISSTRLEQGGKDPRQYLQAHLGRFQFDTRFQMLKCITCAAKRERRKVLGGGNAGRHLPFAVSPPTFSLCRSREMGRKKPIVGLVVFATDWFAKNGVYFEMATRTDTGTISRNDF